MVTHMNRFLAFAIFLSSLLSPLSSLAQEKEKIVKIRWFGQSFFQLESAEGRKFVIDPHAIPAFGRQSATAEFILVSHPHDDHALIEIVEPMGTAKKFNEADIYRGVIDTKTGKQEWKAIDEKRGAIRAAQRRDLPRHHERDATRQK